MRSHLHSMSSSDADLLQNISYGSISVSTTLRYGYGLASDETPTRQHTLTGAEGAGIASLANVGIKAAFGRLRPKQDDHSHTAFFRGGASFVSGDVEVLEILQATSPGGPAYRVCVARPILEKQVACIENTDLAIVGSQA